MSPLEANPWEGIEANPIIKVGVFRAVERVVEIYFDERLYLEPADGEIIAARLEFVPHTYPPDRPIGDGIDRRELRKIDWREQSRRLEAVELEYLSRISVIVNIGKIREWLNDVPQSVKAKAIGFGPSPTRARS